MTTSFPLRLRAVPLILVLPMLLPGHGAAQSADAARRILRVEQGLLTPVVIRGQTNGQSIAARMESLNVPGVSVAVIDGGRIAWAKGYGVKRAGSSEPVDTATLFQAASISKPVAAIAALRLVAEGRLALDEDVNHRLRSWQVPQNGFTRNAPVTLRRLLSHNAGLTVHGFRGYAHGEAVPSVVQVLNGERPANSAAVRADTTPGALWRYSGGGSTVAQLLMQDVTARAFAELMREQVLQPTGMVHSTYAQPLPSSHTAAAATGHRTNGQPVAGNWHTYPEQFAAGLWTTPSDLARLAIQVQRSLRGDSDVVLPLDLTRQILTVQAGEYGLGFGLSSGDGWSAFQHGGSNEGFRAFFVAFADRGQGAIVMTNGDNGGQLASEIIRAIAHEYEWPAQRAQVRDVVQLDDAALAQLTGEYVAQINGVARRIAVRVADGVLQAQGLPFPPPAAWLTLYPGAPDRFFLLQNSAAELRFLRNGAGAVTHMSITGLGTEIRLDRS